MALVAVLGPGRYKGSKAGDYFMIMDVTPFGTTKTTLDGNGGKDQYSFSMISSFLDSYYYISDFSKGDTISTSAVVSFSRRPQEWRGAMEPHALTVQPGGSATRLYFESNADDRPDFVVTIPGVYTAEDFRIKEGVIGLSFTVSIKGKPGKPQPIPGTEGDDHLESVLGRDTLIGGNGNDVYTVDGKRDKIVETEDGGNDTVIANVSYKLPLHVETLILTGPDDISGKGNRADNSIHGNEADNKLSAMGGNDSVFGNAGDDQISGGEGDDSLFGNAGDDTVEGGAGNDSVSGEYGNDTLDGGAGTDTLTGGLGADRFVYAAATAVTTPYETITDFVPGIDTIDLSAIDADTRTAANDAFVLVPFAEATSPGTLTYHDGGWLLGLTDGVIGWDIIIRLSAGLTVSPSDLIL